MKFFIYLIFVISISFNCLTAHELQDVKLVAQTIQHLSHPMDEIWPGFILSDTPTVIHFKNGHAYAFNSPQLAGKWEARNIADIPYYYASEQRELVQIPLHPQYKLAGIPAFVFSMDHGGAADLSLLTLVHERFHIHQFKNFTPIKGEAKYMDQYDLANLALIELENRILQQFLLSQTSGSKQHYLQQYVAVAETRRASLHPASLKWEDHLQRMEGMADYVSVKTYQVLGLLDPFDSAQKLLEMRAKKKGPSLYQDTTRGRHYFVGAALGLALDFYHVDHWKTNVTEGTQSLHQLLANAMPMDKLEQKVRVAAAIKEFDYTTIHDQLGKLLDLEDQQFQEAQQAFARQEGIAICVTMPHQHSTSGGRHTKSYQFEKEQFYFEESSTSITQDNCWKLELQKAPIVRETKDGSRTFKIQAKTQISLDERTYALQEITGPLPFKTLLFKDPHGQFETSLPGTISRIGQELKIQFNA